MSPDRVDQRLRILFVLLGSTANLKVEQGISLGGNDGIEDIQLECMAQLPFIEGSRIMRIEIVRETLLVQRNINSDIG
jgi:hypothetical protein